jgi:hypothetical protein
MKRFKTEEKLPELFQEVLIWDGSNFVVAFLFKDERLGDTCWVADESTFDFEDVDYWWELPEEPISLV